LAIVVTLALVVLVNASFLATVEDFTSQVARQQTVALAPKAKPADLAAPSANKLEIAIERLLGAKALANAQVSVNVVDTATGKTIFAKNPKLALNPASNTKLLTTAAALHYFGPSHRFRTRVLTNATVRKNGVLDGDLFVQADADPSLVSGNLYELGSELVALGVHKITGRLILDISRFDHEGWPPGFMQKEEVASYRAPVGAGSVNYNTFVVYIRPGESPGTGVHLTKVPENPGVEILNEAITGKGGAFRARLDSQWLPDGTLSLALRGTVGVGAGPRSYRFPVPKPSTYTIGVLTEAFKNAGMNLGRKGSVLGETPETAKELAVHRSDPVAVLIRAINKHSNNFMAEQLLWSLAPGPQAKIEAGIEQVRAFTREIGMPQQDLVFGNGSGLYDNNRVSAEQFTHLLSYIERDFPYREEFVGSLAIMGVDGTARRRLRRRTSAGWVRVKTGTLNGVCALSGYAQAPGQAPIVFSILVNGFDQWRIGQVRRIQDGIVHAIVTQMRREPVEYEDPEAPVVEEAIDEPDEDDE
jgi:D-alanyl-D-alanine carboxypeptidase/D-alanyl-D-alanine-endopeptidase (penicillin-binding protein 4)